jgi:hypothetical protein
MSKNNIQPEPPRSAEEQIPGEQVLRSGDPDVNLMDVEYSGEEVPGGSTPTPDQNNVDEVGRAYGLTDEDSGALISAADLIDRRDRRRWELDPRSKDRT